MIQLQPQTAQELRRWPLWYSRLRSYLLWDPLIWFYTVLFGALSLLSSIFDKSGRIQHRFARVWSRMILGTIGVRPLIAGLDKIDTSKAQVYVVNHLSALDIPLLYAYLPFQFRILAKKHLFRYPFMGWHLSRSGQIPVVLESPKASVRSLNRAVSAIKEGNSLVVFPEGGRSRDGQLRPFMGGAFYSALRAQVDVIPIALVGTYEMLKMNTWHIKPGPVYLLVGEPIRTQGLTTRDLEKVSQKAQDAIAGLYYSHSVAPDLRRESLVSDDSRK